MEHDLTEAFANHTRATSHAGHQHRSISHADKHHVGYYRANSACDHHFRNACQTTSFEAEGGTKKKIHLPSSVSSADTRVDSHLTHSHLSEIIWGPFGGQAAQDRILDAEYGVLELHLVPTHTLSYAVTRSSSGYETLHTRLVAHCTARSSVIDAERIRF